MSAVDLPNRAAPTAFWPQGMENPLFYRGQPCILRSCHACYSKRKTHDFASLPVATSDFHILAKTFCPRVLQRTFWEIQKTLDDVFTIAGVAVFSLPRQNRLQTHQFAGTLSIVKNNVFFKFLSWKCRFLKSYIHNLGEGVRVFHISQ